MRLRISPTIGIASGEDAMCSATDTRSALDRPTTQRTVQTTTAACILIGRRLVFNSLGAGRGAPLTPPPACTNPPGCSAAQRRVCFSRSELKTVHIFQKAVLGLGGLPVVAVQLLPRPERPRASAFKREAAHQCEASQRYAMLSPISRCSVCYHY